MRRREEIDSSACGEEESQSRDTRMFSNLAHQCYLKMIEAILGIGRKPRLGDYYSRKKLQDTYSL